VTLFWEHGTSEFFIYLNSATSPEIPLILSSSVYARQHVMSPQSSVHECMLWHHLKSHWSCSSVYAKWG